MEFDKEKTRLHGKELSSVSLALMLETAMTPRGEGATRWADRADTYFLFLLFLFPQTLPCHSLTRPKNLPHLQPAVCGITTPTWGTTYTATRGFTADQSADDRVESSWLEVCCESWWGGPFWVDRTGSSCGSGWMDGGWWELGLGSRRAKSLREGTRRYQGVVSSI